MACFECGAPARHQHHVVPRSRGGTRTVPLCEECHGKAHHHDLTSTALASKGIPYGYRVQGAALVPVPSEIEAIRLARELRAREWTLQAIAAEFARRGIPTRRGGRWHPTQIMRLLGGR